MHFIIKNDESNETADYPSSRIASFTISITEIKFPLFADWSGVNDHDRVQRQLSVSSDSKLLDEDIREETRVIMRPKKPPRPKSEVFLNKQDLHPRRKRFSAFGVSTHECANINCLSFIDPVVVAVV